MLSKKFYLKFSSTLPKYSRIILFHVSEIPKLLCQMSSNGNLEKIKEIFSYMKEDNISGKEMGGLTNQLKKAFPKLLCQMSGCEHLEAVKQIFIYGKEENVSEIEMGGITKEFRKIFPKLIYQILDYKEIEAEKLPMFLVKEIPSFLCQMSSKGDLEKIKQIFAYVKQGNISVEIMGVKNINMK